MGLALGPVKVGFRCRVVDVFDEPRRKGFSYGTLRGHPEAGEEAFTLVWNEDDSVVLHVVAFSSRRPGGPGSAAHRPGRAGWMTDRYLKALV